MFFSADDPSPVEPDQAHADVDHPRADAALSSAQRHGIAPLLSLRDPARCCCLMRDCVDQLPPHRIELSGSVVVIPDVSSWRTTQRRRTHGVTANPLVKRMAARSAELAA